MAAELPLTLDLTNLFYTEVEGSKIQATLGEQWELVIEKSRFYLFSSLYNLDPTTFVLPCNGAPADHNEIKPSVYLSWSPDRSGHFPLVENHATLKFCVVYMCSRSYI